MKRILLFISPVLIISASAWIIFGIVQVREQEKTMMDELHRKARAVTESVEIGARYIFEHNDIRAARRLVESFQRRERTQGCRLYNADGNSIAVTERISSWKLRDKEDIKKIAENKNVVGTLEKFGEYSGYSYILPIFGDSNNFIGAVEVIYDTSYVISSLTELWKRINISLLLIGVATLITMLLLQRQLFVLPIIRLTDWFQRFQKGETDMPTPGPQDGEIGKLTSEVEQVALNLRIARKMVSETAVSHLEKEDLWTETKLHNLISAKLGDNALLVVSNREPYMHILDEATGTVKCIRPAGGVVTAIDPILRACGGTWIGHGAGDMDRKFVNSQDRLGVPPDDNRYILKRVWLSKQEEEGYYYGFSNEGLWPLCHITYIRPIFRDSDWQMYKAVNQKFAESVLKELPSKNAFVFIQDYHFTLLPKLIKQERPDAICAMFWHIPWPNPEVFAICPYYSEIMEGMLGCDLIGFQTQFNCNNFLDTANRLFESRIDTEKFCVIRSGKETSVKAFPISINYTDNGETSADEEKQMAEIKKEYSLEEKIIGIGIERIDYTKGIKERIVAIDRFLEKYPEYKGRFVFIQIGSPSRTHIKSYHDLLGEIDELVEKENWKYSEGGWKPIIYLKRHFSSEEIKPFYGIADFCIVSSLHDGMNLVAKEYVASKNNLKGTLLLSCFTGAIRELTGAVQINPYDIESFADSIKLAIEMPEDEKEKRMNGMRKIVRENNIYRWAGNIITELTALNKI